VQTSENWGDLAAALAAFNAAVTNPIADQIAKVHSKRTNTDFTYPYADLGGITNVVRPALAAHDLSVVQDVVFEEARGWVGAETTIVWGKPGEASQWARFAPVWVPIPDDGSAQDIGKAISYSRRYGYLTALGLATREDSDGPAALSRRQQKPAQTATPKQAAPAAIGQQRAAALIGLANRKGKTAEDLTAFAVALGLDKTKRLHEASPALADRIGRRLEALPDRFDANGVELPAPVDDHDDAPKDEP
jgi:hypothetical protein